MKNYALQIISVYWVLSSCNLYYPLVKCDYVRDKIQFVFFLSTCMIYVISLQYEIIPYSVRISSEYTCFSTIYNNNNNNPIRIRITIIIMDYFRIKYRHSLHRWMFKVSEWAHFSSYEVGLRSGSSASNILVIHICLCLNQSAAAAAAYFFIGFLFFKFEPLGNLFYFYFSPSIAICCSMF